MRVSVILPTYNRAYCISEAIDSVLGQKLDRRHKVELVIIDDASNDDTHKIVKRYANKNVIYIRNEKNYGGAKSRNIGVGISKGEYLSFIDSDVVWRPEKLANQLDALEQNFDKDFVYYCGYRKQLNKKSWKVFPVKYKEGLLLRDLLCGNFIDTPALLLSKRSFVGVGGFDESLPRFQDWDLGIRLARRHAFFPIKKPLYDSYAGKNAISSNDKARLVALSCMWNKYKELILEDPFLARKFMWRFVDANVMVGGQSAVFPEDVDECLSVMHRIVFSLGKFIPASFYKIIRSIY